MGSVYNLGGVLERVRLTPKSHHDLPSESLGEPFTLASDGLRSHPENIRNGLDQRAFVVDQHENKETSCFLRFSEMIIVESVADAHRSTCISEQVNTQFTRSFAGGMIRK